VRGRGTGRERREGGGKEKEKEEREKKPPTFMTKFTPLIATICPAYVSCSSIKQHTGYHM